MACLTWRAGGMFSVSAPLTAFAADFNADQLGAGFSERERVDARVGLKTVQGRINRSDGDRRTSAAVHFRVEMTEDHAGRW